MLKLSLQRPCSEDCFDFFLNSEVVAFMTHIQSAIINE